MPRISHGCHACRKRKIKCSEEKPACQKCIDFKIECPGYDRKAVRPNFRFKDQTERFAGASTIESRSQRGCPAGAHPHDSPSAELVKHPFSGCPLSSEIPSSSVWQMQAFSNFLDIYLPQDDSWKSFSHFKYMTLLPTIARNHPALMSAMDAISTAQLGTIRKDTDLLRNSLSAYGRSLFQLNKALAAAETARMDETLACIIILGLCEFFPHLGGTSRGWVSHVDGARKYLEARGPKSIKSELAIQLFNNSRHASSVAGLIIRKPICYDQPEWLEVTKEMSKTDLYSAAVDEIVRAPRISVQVDNYIKYNDTTFQPIEIIHMIGTVTTGLERWLERFEASTSALYELVDITELRGLPSYVTDHAPVTEVYNFPKFILGHCFVIYNFLMSITLNWSLQVMKAAGERSGANTAAAFPPEVSGPVEQKFRKHLMQMCRCFPFLCRPQSSAIGRVSLLMAVTHAINILPAYDYSPETAWVARMAHQTKSASELDAVVPMEI